MDVKDRSVEEFAKAWVEAKMPIRPPFELPVTTTDIAYSVCLYRSGQFQVELYICKPDTSSPWHSHPGVDSFFMYLTGNLTFSIEGKGRADLFIYQKANPKTGTHMLLGKTVSSPDGKQHTLTVGPEGGAFLSFEKWHDKPPTSVTLNWAGEAVGPEHQSNLDGDKLK